MKATTLAGVLALLLALPAPLPAAPKPAAPKYDAAKDPQVVVIGLIGSKAVLRINGQQSILGPGESSDGVTLRDVVAHEAVLSINGREVHLGMGADTGGIAARAPGGSVEIVMNPYGQFITTGMINGRVVDFLVDTGATTVSMTTEDARALGIDYKLNGRPAASVTASGTVAVWLVHLASVRLGPIEIKDVQATVRETPRMTPILLGMSFLGRVDLQHEQNRLKITAR